MGNKCLQLNKLYHFRIHFSKIQVGMYISFSGADISSDGPREGVVGEIDHVTSTLYLWQTSHDGACGTRMPQIFGFNYSWSIYQPTHNGSDIWFTVHSIKELPKYLYSICTRDMRNHLITNWAGGDNTCDINQYLKLHLMKVDKGSRIEIRRHD